MRATTIRAAVTAAAACSFVVACNAILDNDAAVLASEETGTVPERPDAGLPPPELPDVTTPDALPDVIAEAGVDASDGCGLGQRLCGELCAAVDDPLHGCGAPSCQACALARAAAACQGSRCVIGTCDKGFADCNGNPADGCETDLSRATSCGSCNAVCPAATPLCAPLETTFACTTGCAPAAPLLCGTECVDPLSSENHCGGCNHECDEVSNATTECHLGECVSTCKSGFHSCSGKCLPVADPSACGALCVVCPAPAHGHALCTAGACASKCDPGFSDCDANPANGCESELAKDPANCGACGRACDGGTCNAGACQAPPPPPPDGGP